LPLADACTIRDLGVSVTGSERRAIVSLGRGATIFCRLIILIAVFFAINLVSLAQSTPSIRKEGGPPLAPSRAPYESKHQSSFFTHLKPQTLEAPYRPITPRERLSWATANTIDPSNLAGELALAGLGTAPNRPKEYGPHWGGFADRYGMGMAGSVTGNAIEASAGLILREDPRYFRVPGRPFRARLRNVVRLTFAARAGNGNFRPAYARYMAVFGNNFVANSWRANSEANTHDALIRSAEGAGGYLAGNAFEEFWPDVKKWLLHKRN